MRTMNGEAHGQLRVELLFRQLSGLAAATVIFIAVAVLLGWAFDIEQLMTCLPGYIRMKPNTAVAFLAVGVALLFEYHNGSVHIRRFAACIPLALGAGTLIQYVSGLSLHIDELFFLDPIQKIYPGRMAHVTAVNFVLLGLALLCRTRPRSPKVASSALAIVVTTSSLFAIVGYAYGVPLLYGSMHYTAMALHTGVSFLLLSLALVFIDPQAAAAKMIWSDGAGGVVARRLLPLALILPIVMGRLFVSTTFNGGDLRLGMAFKAMTSTILFAAVIAHLCHTLTINNRKTLAAEASLHFDGLTGIHNRRYFDSRLAEEAERSKRYGAPLALALFDADLFKQINDVHGHVGGDEVLKAIATVASVGLRSSDAVCRYGGEEFVLILPETTMQEATVIAERIRVLISDWVEAATGIHVTVSVGVTCLSAADESLNNVIARADAALYEAKADGRNRVRSRAPGLYEVPKPSPPPQLATAV